MKRLLLVLVVGVLALAAGAAVAGRPTSVPHDVVIDQPPATTDSVETSAPIATIPTPPSTTSPTTTTTTTTIAATDVTSSDTDPSPETTNSTSPTETAAVSASTTLVPESGLRLAVANATRAPGIATDHAAILRGIGYVDATAIDAATDSGTTSVYFSYGFRAEARRLAQQIGLDENVVQPRPTDSLTVDAIDADLWLVVGADRVP